MPKSFGAMKNGVCNSTVPAQYTEPPSASLLVPAVRSRRPQAAGAKARPRLGLPREGARTRSPPPAPPAGAVPPPHANKPDDGRHPLVVQAAVPHGLDEVHITARARHVLLEVQQEPARRVPVVVERVVDEAVTDGRDQDLTLRQLPADSERGFAVEIAT